VLPALGFWRACELLAAARPALLRGGGFAPTAPPPAGASAASAAARAVVTPRAARVWCIAVESDELRAAYGEIGDDRAPRPPRGGSGGGGESGGVGGGGAAPAVVDGFAHHTAARAWAAARGGCGDGPSSRGMVTLQMAQYEFRCLTAAVEVASAVRSEVPVGL